MPRPDGRAPNQMRPVSIEPGYLKYPYGSVLISFGNTKVICTVTVEEKVPGHVAARSATEGWITAEYALLPASGLSRNPRAGYGNTQVKGRVHEIQRLIGRALRAAVDLKKLGPRTLTIDCDVLQADGGTRTASVTGTWVALEMAARRLLKEKKIETSPIIAQVAAVSVGIVDGQVVTDLDYIEDAAAGTDLNLIMERKGGIIEVQGTAEEGVFSRAELDAMLKLGEEGIRQLFTLQDEALRKLS